MKISFDDDREDIIIGKKTEVKKDDKKIKVSKKTDTELATIHGHLAISNSDTGIELDGTA